MALSKLDRTLYNLHIADMEQFTKQVSDAQRGRERRSREKAKANAINPTSAVDKRYSYLNLQIALLATQRSNCI
jgi:hypothetical protein